MTRDEEGVKCWNRFHFRLHVKGRIKTEIVHTTEIITQWNLFVIKEPFSRQGFESRSKILQPPYLVQGPV